MLHFIKQIFSKFTQKYTTYSLLFSTSENSFTPLSASPSGYILSQLDISTPDKRYELENLLLQAVSQGLTQKAEQLLSLMHAEPLEVRSSDPLRNLQNYSIILNTLLRKSAEKGMVPPYYLDRLSSDFGHKIEAATTLQDIRRLQQDMIHKYCLLVKNHAMKGYSPLVQKIILRIDTDLSADLTLKSMAETLNINASYLSFLFKKETGSTLTEYVNKKRVEYGILLLNSTTLQIQTIAQYCGIPDMNYFTKLFKKYYGMSPSSYREQIQKKADT